MIDNAAREPEIADIAAFLVAMGARIEGAGTNTIEIDGVNELAGTEHVTIPDRIEAGTWAAAAVATRRRRPAGAMPAPITSTCC